METTLPDDLRASVRAYVAKLAARFAGRVRLVRVFGSWARGEAREDSDLDVAVVIEGLTHAEWNDAVGDAVEVELDGGASISPYVVSGEHFDRLVQRERKIAADILREGVAA